MKNLKTFEQYSQELRISDHEDDEQIESSIKNDQFSNINYDEDGNQIANCNYCNCEDIMIHNHECKPYKRGNLYNGTRRKVIGDEVVESKKLSYKKSGLYNPKEADLNKDNKISDYENKRGKAIEKSILKRNKK